MLSFYLDSDAFLTNTHENEYKTKDFGRRGKIMRNESMETFILRDKMHTETQKC